MRIVRALLLPVITIILIVILSRPIGALPALGTLLDPVNGWAANAEPVNTDFTLEFSLPGLHHPVTVAIEDRLVPHIKAADDHDLYMMQGYIHAYFRLWQMDLQTRAAAGRVSEVTGEKWVIDQRTGKKKNATLDFDRAQRRKGMVYAAEKSLEAMEADTRTKTMLDAYTAGVNQYIETLNYRELPLEYKLMCFEPEPWTNLKSALLLKYMADDLTGYTEDVPLTLLREQLPKEEFELLFPQRIKGSIPVIPEGTQYAPASLPTPDVPEGDLWSHLGAGNKQTVSKSRQVHTDPNYTAIGGAWEGATAVGSNSWAVSGTYTTSGSPILCNDPHLGLNLPSLWYEMQLQAPGINTYGVSLPGAPGVIIGFNDSVAWGFTNNYRDVKDWYEIEAIDRDFYRMDSVPQPFEKRVEVISIKGAADYIDTVSYTVHGPMMYDETFQEPTVRGKNLAVCWMAHRGTNELLSVYMLNRARNYIEFTEAIMHFECPAQNMVYADRAGNIAMWGQGQFINKWKDQGRYVMKGNTSATLWGENIPMTENPNVLNPPQGYLASANQITTDTTYPYWYNGYFYDFRAWRVNAAVKATGIANVEKMFAVQNETYSVLAAQALPVMLLTLDKTDEHTAALGAWNYYLHAEDKSASFFQIWWELFFSKVWERVSAMTRGVMRPSVERTMQLLQADSTRFREDLLSSYRMTIDSIAKIEGAGGADSAAQWYKVKNTSLTHLTKIGAFSYKELKIGGWGNTINAAKSTHGPSWRMVVEMGREAIRAYGVYPGGQSGNPGSKYYGTFVNKWLAGAYYPILFMNDVEKDKNEKVKYTWTVKPSNKG